MVNKRVFQGWKILGRKASSPERLLFWKNPIHHPYIRGHYASSNISVLSPTELASERIQALLKENVVDPNAFQAEKFPLIEDFEVILADHVYNIPLTNSTYDVYFFSPSHGMLTKLTSLPEFIYSPAGLCQENFRIPCGDFTLPYYDFEQAFALMIVEEGDFVHILRGTSEEVETIGYRIWFKVERERYFTQWENAIQLCRDYCATKK